MVKTAILTKMILMIMVEAHTPEEVDITEFLKEYCKYNKYSEEETV